MRIPAIGICVENLHIAIPINVTPKQLTGIEMMGKFSKTIYLEKVGQLDLTGERPRLNYNFGPSEDLPIVCYDIVELPEIENVLRRHYAAHFKCYSRSKNLQ